MRSAVDRSKPRRDLHTDTAIVGAGPYGLSIAAHLAHYGVPSRAFGRPMDTWRNHMPVGMLLKSDGFASSLSAPVADWTLGQYCTRAGVVYGDREPRVALDRFTEYGLAFQKHFVPELEEQQVVELSTAPSGFSLVLDDGTEVSASRVVAAVGITHFAFVPPELRALDRRITHSSEHRDFTKFAGRRVAVMGSGSSAVEVAASLLDVGAEVHLLARSEEVRFWSEPPPEGSKLTWLEGTKNPSTGLGPGWRNKFCQDLPDVFRLLPSDFRLKVVRHHLGPVSGWWLRDKVLGMADVRAQTRIDNSMIDSDEVVLTLLDAQDRASQLAVDHVVAATGYLPDIDQLRFLDSNIRQALQRIATMPALSHNFESSVPGLYFVGNAAMGSFGPLMRFMVGAEFAAPRVAKHICRRARSTFSTRSR